MLQSVLYSTKRPPHCAEPFHQLHHGKLIWRSTSERNLVGQSRPLHGPLGSSRWRRELEELNMPIVRSKDYLTPLISSLRWRRHTPRWWRLWETHRWWTHIRILVRVRAEPWLLRWTGMCLGRRSHVGLITVHKLPVWRYGCIDSRGRGIGKQASDVG
jgi:hypothetical protein